MPYNDYNNCLWYHYCHDYFYANRVLTSPLHTCFVWLGVEGRRGKRALVLIALPLSSVPAHLHFSLIKFCFHVSECSIWCIKTIRAIHLGILLNCSGWTWNQRWLGTKGNHIFLCPWEVRGLPTFPVFTRAKPCL